MIWFEFNFHDLRNINSGLITKNIFSPLQISAPKYPKGQIVSKKTLSNQSISNQTSEMVSKEKSEKIVVIVVISLIVSIILCIICFLCFACFKFYCFNPNTGKIGNTPGVYVIEGGLSGGEEDLTGGEGSTNEEEGVK